MCMISDGAGGFIAERVEVQILHNMLRTSISSPMQQKAKLCNFYSLLSMKDTDFEPFYPAHIS